MPPKTMSERNYKREYENYHKKPEQRARRSSRNKARRLMIKKKGEAAVRGKDVDHKNRSPMDNRPSDLRIQSKKENRGRNK